MKIKTKFFIFSILFIVISLAIKLNFAKSFYFEMDDTISIHQILKYKDQNLFTIAKDKESPTYSSVIKKKLREIENEDNLFYKKSIEIISKVLRNAAPSKTSTFAPMQYILFADLIKRDHNYEQLKFFSRLPSIIFSGFYLLLTYFFCNCVFSGKNKYSFLSIVILITSFPLLYISLRSYNYSVGTLTTTLIFFITYLELINKNFDFIKISNERLNFLKSIILAGFFSLL